jgi:hypothetical protein
MSEWTFVSEDWPQPISAITAEDLKNVRRDKLQAASDIYKVMQARMDGYRQSAAAVFTGRPGFDWLVGPGNYTVPQSQLPHSVHSFRFLYRSRVACLVFRLYSSSGHQLASLH